jgi:hypothetical protein
MIAHNLQAMLLTPCHHSRILACGHILISVLNYPYTWILAKAHYLHFKLQMDLLNHFGTSQALSVPSERIFSSSKETCTLQCSNLSLATLKALQVLKFIYKQDRLNFMEDLVADE